MSSSRRTRASAQRRRLRIPRSQDLEVLLHEPRGRCLQNEVAVQRDRLDHLLVEVEAQARAEHRRPQHADGIFDEPDLRIADRADRPALQIRQAAHVVDDGERRDVVEERVDRSPAEMRPLSGVPNVLSRWTISCMPGGPADATTTGAGPPASAGSASGGSGRACGRSPPRSSWCRTSRAPGEAPADDPAVPEQPLDLIRMRVRADVEILRLAPEHQVADAAPDEYAVWRDS